MTTTLRIPYGLDSSGIPIHPLRADRGGTYSCPECHAPLVLRAGPIKIRHFAHRSETSDCALLGESWQHIAAKHAILLAVSEWRTGHAAPPVIERVCNVCYSRRFQPIPDRVHHAVIEQRGTGENSSMFIADVALADADDTTVALIEIHVTHRVDSQKENTLGRLPWIEVEATEILENPAQWIPIAQGNLKHFPCLCDTATRMPVIERGLALHVDGCPIRSRVYRGKPYANVIDDCTCCPHYVGEEHRQTEPGGMIALMCGWPSKNH
ncbi:MAG: competence protein CoiA family protein [Phycisphaerales bacterium]